MSRDEPPPENGRNGPEQEHKAFVGGISWHMNDRELKDTFRNKGYAAKDAAVMLDKMTGRSRGFGFVTFATEEELAQAVKHMHDSDLDGRKISCTKAIPQSETAPGTPASALAGGPDGPRAARYGGGPDRYRERGYERGLERPPPRGFSASRYDDRRGYERGGYGGYSRQPERGYDRAYPPADYDRGYDRGYGPPAYGYEREAYGGSYGREPANYGREGYPPERGYGGPAYGEPGYERGAYGSGYGSAAYDRGYDDRGYGGREAYSSRGAAPAREGAYSRPGPERDYARSAARAPGPYERPASSLPPR